MSRQVVHTDKPIIGLVLSVVGFGVSTYLTITHFSRSVGLACSAGGLVNCERVTTSPQSMFLHIPVAVLGLAFFAAMIVLYSPPTWRMDDQRLRIARVLMPLAGVGFAAWLVYAELRLIRAICLWCTVTHVAALALLLLGAYAVWPIEPEDSESDDDEEQDETGGDVRE